MASAACAADRCNGILVRVMVDIGGDDFRARLGKFLAINAADALAATGDDDDFAFNTSEDYPTFISAHG